MDELLEAHGHSVLRLPPYHPELNPIEKIWATVKNWVGTNNVSFKLQDVETLTRQKFSSITVEEWQAIRGHVERVERSFIEKEHLLDTADDSLIFDVNTSSDSDTDTDTEGVLSGIEPLEEEED